MVDGQGNQGGASNITQVGSSNDAGCLTSSSPSSTTRLGGSQTPTSSIPTSTSTPTSTDASKSSGNHITIGGIAGTAIGGILFLVMVVTLALFFHRKKGALPSQGGFKRRVEHGDQADGAHLGPPASAYTLQNSYQPDANPFGSSTASAPYQSPISAYQVHSNAHISPSQRSESRGQLSNPHSPNSVPAATSAELLSRIDSEQLIYERQRAKALAAGLQPPPRYIVHTAVEEDEVPRPDENGIVDLPPRYTTIIGRPAVIDPPSDLAYLSLDVPATEQLPN